MASPAQARNGQRPTANSSPLHGQRRHAQGQRGHGQRRSTPTATTGALSPEILRQDPIAFVFLYRDPIAFGFLDRDPIVFHFCTQGHYCVSLLYSRIFMQILCLLSISHHI
jgi:hypothetical protein